MIIKDQLLDEQLYESFFQIKINNSQNIEGSYKFKPYGSFVSDIDYTVYSNADTNLINSIKRIIKIKNKFIFIHLSCGNYPEFVPPWKITNTGCDFNYIEAVEWYQNIKIKFEPETISFIENKLFRKTLTIRDIIEINLELEKYSDIKWTRTDILNGYKIDKYDTSIRYDLLNTLRNYHPVLKFLFIYSNRNDIDYIPVDIGILKPNEKRGIIQKCNPFYTENWYRIFKSLKWKIKSEFKSHYLIALLKIDYQNALLNRLKMLKRIISQQLINEDKILELQSKIGGEIANPLSEITEHDLTLESLIKQVEKNISLTLEEDAKYFIDKLKKQSDIVLKHMYLDRAVVYASIPVSIKNLMKRSDKGIRCPFFDVDDEEYNFLYQFSVDLLLEPIKSINCFIQIANDADLLVKNIIDINIENNFFLKMVDDKVELYKRNRGTNIKLREFNKKDLKHIQQFLFRRAFKLKLKAQSEPQSEPQHNIETENRLTYISNTNPIWFSYIIDFVERNPIFKQYLYMVALEPKMNQFKDRNFPKTIKKAILYYICFAGVRADFGNKLWLLVKTLKTKKEILESPLIPPKKKEYLSKAIELPDNFSLEDLLNTKVGGIGVSGIAFINNIFSAQIVSENVEYTDICVLEGLKKIYNLENRPTPKEALDIINTWGVNKSIGNMFSIQACNYL